MSIYKDLNDVNLDINQYEEQELTSLQKKNWESRVLKKIRKNKTRHTKKYVGVAAAVILATGISLSSGTVTFANIPFVGGMIEGFIGTNEHVNYDTYKTAIGTTAENEYGKWTLNEAMIDSGRLLISSTFEPAKGVKFNYKMHPMPTILMNGQSLTSGTLSQSIKVHDSMYTIYNEVRISDLPIGETIAFHIKYDNLDWSIDKKVLLIDKPWVFDIQVPTEQLAAASETIVFDQEVQIGDGLPIRLNKLVVSPVSTILYYDWPEQENHISFKIVSESGTEIYPSSATISPEGSDNRYITIDLKAEKYYLVPIERSENSLTKDRVKIDAQPILINP